MILLFAASENSEAIREANRNNQHLTLNITLRYAIAFPCPLASLYKGKEFQQNYNGGDEMIKELEAVL